MIESNAGRKEAVRNAILRYLCTHPHASDAAMGISAWWLPTEGVHDTGPWVEEVLEELVDERLMQRFELADGTLIYGGAAARDSDDDVDSREST